MYNNYAIKPISQFDSFQIFLFTFFFLSFLQISPLFSHTVIYVSHGTRLIISHARTQRCPHARTHACSNKRAHKLIMKAAAGV